MAEVRLLRGEVALVDDEDVPALLKYRWYKSSEGYAIAAVGPRRERKVVWMHRLVLGVACDLDHKDGNKLNNQKFNLRLATDSQNGGNRKVNSSKSKTSKFKGVCWDKRLKRWRASIKAQCSGISSQKELGRFKSETEAALAYNVAAKKHFREFALLNPI